MLRNSVLFGTRAWHSSQVIAPNPGLSITLQFENERMLLLATTPLCGACSPFIPPVADIIAGSQMQLLLLCSSVIGAAPQRPQAPSADNQLLFISHKGAHCRTSQLSFYFFQDTHTVGRCSTPNQISDWVGLEPGGREEADLENDMQSQLTYFLRGPKHKGGRGHFDLVTIVQGVELETRFL